MLKNLADCNRADDLVKVIVEHLRRLEAIEMDDTDKGNLRVAKNAMAAVKGGIEFMRQDANKKGIFRL